MSPPVTLSLIWFFCLGGLGAIFPFYSLYLRENAGLSGVEVGAVMAVLPAVGVATQVLWGQIADRTGSRSAVLALLGAGAALGYAGLVLPESFAGFLLGTALLAVFSASLIPTCVSVSLALLGGAGGSGRFGRVRVWGTVGFGVVVGSLPFLLPVLPAPGSPVAGASEPRLGAIFPLAAMLVGAGTLLALSLPRTGAVSLRAQRGEWRLLLAHAPFRRVLVTTFLIYLCLQGPMSLFPILVRAQGGGVEAVSRMWLLMISIEIPLVAFFGAGLARFGPRGLIAIGSVAAAIRWAVSGFADDLLWISLVQVLHGVTVWGVVLGAPMYVDAVVPERLRSTGQAMLVMVGVSLAAIVSNTGSGWLIDRFGATTPAQVGGIGALLLALALPWLLPPTGGSAGDTVASAGGATAPGAAADVAPPER